MKTRRHDLVTLDTAARPLGVTCQTSAAAAVHVAEWISAERPFVYPRQTGDAQTMQLGLAFIDAGVKHLAVIQADRRDVRRIAPPLALDECLDAFGAEDALVLDDLCFAMQASRLSLFVFGSVSWEKISGQQYRHPDSDVDVLCDVATWEELEVAVARLRNAERKLSMRLDGELRLPDDACVNWREAMQALDGATTHKLLVKSETGVSLQTLDNILGDICLS